MSEYKKKTFDDETEAIYQEDNRWLIAKLERQKEMRANVLSAGRSLAALKEIQKLNPEIWAFSFNALEFMEAEDANKYVERGIKEVWEVHPEALHYDDSFVVCYRSGAEEKSVLPYQIGTSIRTRIETSTCWFCS